MIGLPWWRLLAQRKTTRLVGNVDRLWIGDIAGVVVKPLRGR